MKCVRIILLPIGSESLSRFSIMQNAYRCGVRGFVSRENRDKLLIEAEGSDEQVSDFLKSFHRWSFWVKAQVGDITETDVKNYTAFEIIKNGLNAKNASGTTEKKEKKQPLYFATVFSATYGGKKVFDFKNQKPVE